MSATLPPLHVKSDPHAAAESVLEDGESLSSLVETSVRTQIEFHRVQKVFIARGLASCEDAKRTGVYFTAEQSLARLNAILQKCKPGSA
ncbi:MAG: prevent-host-death protein [Pseudomonadota bacterium]|nr:prevent-host-death protein [Pseudomonadota bacterium]